MNKAIVGALLATVFLVSAFNKMQITALGGEWDIVTVDSLNDVGRWSSIAIDGNGRPHISYYDATNGYLKHAWWTGSQWSRQTVDDGSMSVPRADVGKFSSIAIDGNGRVHITYYDATHDRLKYAYQDPFWNRVYLDGTGTGKWSSIAIDSQNQPHISYYNETGGDLKYAWRNGFVWQKVTVDSTGDVGRWSSIAVDSGDKPHISYRDATNGWLKYAKWTGSEWSIQAVWTGDVGWYSSIALDSSDNPHINHYDAANGDLKYIYWAPNVWIDRGGDQTGDVGSFSSIALDSGDKAHISYYDATNGELKYAEYTGTYGSPWNIETVDSTYNVGKWTSITLDGGYVHISYYDVTYGNLKYASKALDLVYGLAINNIVPSKNVVGQGYSMSINVTVENQRDTTETINVTLSMVGPEPNYCEMSMEQDVPPGQTTLTFDWNTTGLGKGNYTLSANATILPGETYTEDNTLVDGWVIVAMVGDITGSEGWPDGRVDIRDVATAAKAYGTSPGHPRWNPEADIDNNAKIDIRDVATAALHFGQMDP